MVKPPQALASFSVQTVSAAIPLRKLTTCGEERGTGAGRTATEFSAGPHAGSLADLSPREAERDCRNQGKEAQEDGRIAPWR